MTSIGYGAFFGCSGLTEIKVVEGNTKYDSRNGCNAIIDTEKNALIFGCKNTQIPEDVTSIRSSAFKDCSGLESITIPGSVTSIGEEAFSGCSGLDTITVDANNTKYDSRDNCNAIIESSKNALVSGCQNTTIPDSVTSIRSGAFKNCSGLKNIAIPESVTSIGEGAFKGCSQLTEITIPGNMTSIGEEALSGCSGLEKITVDSNNPKYDSRGDCNAIIEKSGNVLISGSKNTVIPTDVTNIGNYAFSGCSGLNEIIIPEGVTSIGGGAFENCESLANIVIPESVMNIGGAAFSGCKGLTNITIPSSVTRIWGGTFQDCENLARVTIPPSVTRIDDSAFSGCAKNLTIYGTDGSAAKTFAERNELNFEEISDNDISWVKVILDQTICIYDGKPKTPAVTVELFGKTLAADTDYTVEYSNNTDIGTAKVTVKGKGKYSGIKEKEFTIEEAADGFEVSEDGIITKYTGNKREVLIPPEYNGTQITGIGKGAFSDCSNLTGIEIPATVTTIKSGAFSGCSGLGEITISNNVRSIGKSVFSDCSSLSEITIPKNVTSIVDKAFSGCSGLTKITVAEGNTRYDSRNNCNAIIDKKNNALILGCKNTKIPSEVISIGNYAFCGCNGLREITIPDKVTSIGGGAFSGCSALSKIIIPDKVTSIGGDAFSDCSSLSEIAIPRGVEVIWSGTFRNCSSLTSVKIPASVTSIDEGAFYHCGDLTISGIAGSAAETFAERNDLNFNAVLNDDIDIDQATVTLSQNSYTYDGKPKTPSVKVEFDGDELTLNTDYTVSYSNNVKEGTAAVTVTGKGVYTGSKTVNFAITKATDKPEVSASLSGASVTLSETSYTYDGKAKTPTVTVKLDGKTLTLNTDYTVSYSNNVEKGTAAVTVTGKGSYTGSKTVNFTIKKKDQPASAITCKKTLYKAAYGAKPFKIKASSKDNMTFTSSKPKVAAVDKKTGKVTIKKTGIAVITVKTAKKSVKVTIEISPKKPSVKTAKPEKGKKLKVSWKKDKMASGYQVQVSTNKKFNKDKKSKKLSKTSYTFTKLKAGKKYYVRIRSYKKYGKKTLYSAWSKTKQTGKIKK